VRLNSRQCPSTSNLCSFIASSCVLACYGAAYVSIQIHTTFAARRLHKRGLCRRAMSVPLSVRLSVRRLSVTFVCRVKTSKHILKLFPPSVSHTILVFFIPSLMPVFRQGPPNGGVECSWGIKKSRFSTNVSLHRGYDKDRALPRNAHVCNLSIVVIPNDLE